MLGFTQFIGSPFVAAVKQRIDGRDKGLVIPQAWSASLLGSPYVRTVGATYDVETINAVGFLLDRKRIASGDRIGHVYFEGDYGENALTGAKAAAKEAGLTVVEQKKRRRRPPRRRSRPPSETPDATDPYEARLRTLHGGRRPPLSGQTVGRPEGRLGWKHG
ncbi:hypothetical protein ACFWBH_02005 [Streptomyces sp. NPDC059999]|uniref:hypothetical protein n=1 Tax=Streptomyces sp. NPDC059999 TaxID=3347030 RepID=UPI0036A14C55